MLKSKVGHSTDINSYNAGAQSAGKASEGMMNAKLGFLFTSVKNDVKEVVKGAKSVMDAPIIGCTSSGAVMTPYGIITGEDGFAGMMVIDDPDMTVGVACHEAGKDP